MIRLSLLALALFFIAPALAPQPAEAAQTEKKKKADKGRSGYSAEERKKIMERAREVCRNNHGSPSRVYRVDYKRMVVYCMPPAAG